MAEEPEHEFLGKHKDKMWTYLILMVVLVVIVIAINFVWKNPDRASNGVHDFLGLPGWALAAIGFVIGVLVYWGGLKVETDWPEAVGAFLIAGSVAALELIVGWNNFDVGGMVVIPYLIPIVLFVLLLGYAMKRSA